MVDNGGNGAAAEAAAERKPTERVILQHSHVLLLPGGGVDREMLTKVIEMLGLKGPGGRRAKPEEVLAEGWLEVARKTASTKTAAIEAHAGKPGTADALVGTFRAPTLTAWKDGVKYDAPPMPLVERTVVE